MPRMAAGQMDQTITLREPRYTKTPKGFTKTEYTDQSVWANVQFADVVLDGLVDDIQVRDAIQMRARIRYNPHVATEWRVRYRGEEWIVISVQQLGIKDETLLRCHTGVVVV